MGILTWLQDLKQSTLETEESEPPQGQDLKAQLEQLGHVSMDKMMVPRALVTALDVDVQLRRFRRLKSSKVNYFPVYKGDLDNILGWISKERLLQLRERGEDIQVIQHVQPVPSVQETSSAPELAETFLASGAPLVVVKNSLGGTAGIVWRAEFLELLSGVSADRAPTLAATTEPNHEI